MAHPGSWAEKRGRLLARQERALAARGPDLNCLWQRSDADYAQWPICSSICTRKFNFISTGLHWSPQSWLILRPWSLRLGLCLFLDVGPDVMFCPLSLLETSPVVRSTWQEYWPDCQYWWPWLKMSPVPEPQLAQCLEITQPVRQEQSFPPPDAWLL